MQTPVIFTLSFFQEKSLTSPSSEALKGWHCGNKSLFINIHTPEKYNHPPEPGLTGTRTATWDWEKNRESSAVWGKKTWLLCQASHSSLLYGALFT